MKPITPNLSQAETDDVKLAGSSQSQAVTSVVFQSEPIPGSSGRAVVEYATIKLTPATDKLVFHLHPLSQTEILKIVAAVDAFCNSKLKDAGLLRAEASPSPVIRSGFDMLFFDVPNHLTTLVLRSLLDIITTAIRG